MDRSDESSWFAAQGRLSLSRASTHLERGELEEASETAWLAASHMVKAVAVRRDLPHEELRDIHGVVGELVKETGDESLYLQLGLAHQLEWHAGDRCLSDDLIELYMKHVAKFVDRLQGLLNDV